MHSDAGVSRGQMGDRDLAQTIAPPILEPRPVHPLRWVELAALFGGIPLLYAQDPRAVSLLLVLPTLGAVCMIALLLDRSFDNRSLWRTGGLLRELPRMALTFLLGAGIITLGVALFEPDNLLALPRERPRLWVMIMVFYPLLSVFPQEIIFRTFFFHRYRPLVAGPLSIITMSGLAFGFAHLMFKDPFIAISLTAIGGVLFAWTYHRTQSTLAAAVEHALFGNFVFTIGLGSYFFTGAVQ